MFTASYLVITIHTNYVPPYWEHRAAYNTGDCSGRGAGVVQRVVLLESDIKASPSYTPGLASRIAWCGWLMLSSSFYFVIFPMYSTIKLIKSSPKEIVKSDNFL